ncbi:Uncharacterised protein [Bordetella pertussis]|nr:Uncharacterised protein [Bordetella pertussis]
MRGISTSSVSTSGLCFLMSKGTNRRRILAWVGLSK